MAFVDDGSVLLGLPGAPGCTTTGLPESFCCADVDEEKTPPKASRTTRQCNGAVNFTTGLQNRPRTPAMAMSTLMPVSDFEGGDLGTETAFFQFRRLSGIPFYYARVLRRRAYCKCHEDDFDEQRA